MHQQAKNKRDGCASAGQRRRGTDMRLQDKEKRDRCTSSIRRRGTDMHLQDKEKRDRCAKPNKDKRDRYAPAG
jgi:hypothetical protein